MEHKIFDCTIIGGGLAGLSLAILLAQKKYTVLLIEKKTYPYHKVCGEYISNESWDFLVRLGIPLDQLNLPQIHEVRITGVDGSEVTEKMTLGGFGISRFTLDKLLAEQAKLLGVTLLESATCTKYEKKADQFEVNTSTGIFNSRLLVAGFGRHAFGNFYKAKKESENWIGVKYHIDYKVPIQQIALHTFKDGYAGISKVDHQRYCLCYLVRASLLKTYHNKIPELEKNELCKNPFLHEIFTHASFLYDKPLTVSNITFDIKKPVIDDVFYIGDSAGAIAPLTGNGMSNAMRSAHLLSLNIDDFLAKRISFNQLKSNYTTSWNQAFKIRINKGRLIQHFFCNHGLTPFFIGLMNQSKWLRKMVIKQTHGERF
ncbi:MAG: NAD(P)/FAD-dependent oxidoreductase [Bacteroidetes bacterium]|nr:NAD(P)/FAD-dependent oxidoreductase [Bacteroidota bacterium]